MVQKRLMDKYSNGKLKGTFKRKIFTGAKADENKFAVN